MHRNIKEMENESTDHVVRLEKICKSYCSGEIIVPVLDCFSMAVARGEFTVLLGVSGSGKTTLLNLIGAMDSPDSGRIIIDGLDISNAPRATITDIRRKKIGYIFQFYNLIPTLTVEENVEMGLELLGLERNEILRRSGEFLEKTGIKRLARKFPDQLSGGEQQRVAIARALAKKPAIVLADEPTGNLDEHTALSVIEMMKELNRNTKTTFIIATHNKELAAEASRVFHIVDGRLSGEDTEG